MPASPDDAGLIKHTQNWLRDIVIGHGLCPFAKAEHDAGTIRYAVIRDDDLQSQAEDILTACAALDARKNIETTLLIFPAGLSGFEDYLSLIDLAVDALKAAGYEGVYQLASFHPDYRFAGSESDDPANYTNRSPYPVVHILREASVEKAIADFSNPENIPARNIRLTRGLGIEVMRDLLAGCLQ